MKRVMTKLNSVAAVLLALVLVLMIGFISLRNPVRIDISDQHYYQLSRKTLELLDHLDRDVHVTVFFQAEHPLYDNVRNLLEEYQYHSRHILVDWVDPKRDPARTEKLSNKFGLNEAQVVVFDIDGKSKVVRQSDLAEKEIVKGRNQPVMKAFKGEQAFSSAIQGLVQGETPVVYFLVGHGEHRITDFDKIAGYSTIDNIILHDNIDAKELLLAGQKKIPDDAAALVIAGPLKKMSSFEVGMIEDYLSRGGRLLVMLDALKETGLEGMLRRWGVALRNDIVVDPEDTLHGNDVHIRRFDPHPICLKMNYPVVFILPRSVEPLVGENNTGKMKDLQTVSPLLRTSDKGWSETQVNNPVAKFDENTGDRRGPVHLGVAVERGAKQDKLDVQIKPSKMVVFGDSDYVSNGNMVDGNSDLFMSSLDWLLDRDQLMAIPPKPIEKVKLSLTKKQLKNLFWINVVGLPGVAVVLGSLVWSRRRK